MKPKKLLFDKIKLVCKKILKKKVNIKSKIYDFKEWDSFANFNILLHCEKVFKIKFSANEFSKINNIKEIYSTIEKKNNK